MPHPKEKIFEIDDHIGRRFDVQKRLGKGAYGIVWKAIDRKTKEVVAVKKIFDAFRNQTDAQRTFREIMFLQSLKNHPNIVKLHSIHRAANNSDIYLGFEYMETDLHNVIKRGILKDIHKKYIMYQLFKAIKYIHSGNVIHRDLKPSNILLDIMCRCKIADFGLARSLTQQISEGNFGETDPTLTDYVATRWYRAPEILIANKRYTKGIDMWSLGCILAEITAGKPVFPGSSTVNQVEKIMATIPTPPADDINSVCVTAMSTSMIKNASAVEKVPLASLLGKHFAKEALSLINQLLVFNPVNRLTAAEAIKHEYVSVFHNPEQEMILTRDIVIPFSDDVRLSVEDYRNKLYEIMSSHHQQTRTKDKLMQSCKSRMITAPDMPAKVHVGKHFEKSKSSTTTTTKGKSHSEPKINSTINNNVRNHAVASIRSDSRVTKQNIQFPKGMSCGSNQLRATGNRSSDVLHQQNIKEHQQQASRRRLSNGSNNSRTLLTCNSYHQTHGVINHSTLMELRAAGLR